MTDSQVKSWLKSHSHLHSDFAGWLRSLTDDEYADFLSATESCLLYVPLDRAEDISRKMFAGRIPKPFAFSGHPAVVREHGEVFQDVVTDKRTVGEIEREREAAMSLEKVLPELREMFKTMNIVPKGDERPEATPAQCAAAQQSKCPYCEGIVTVINGLSACSDCGCWVGDIRLPYEEAMLAKVYGQKRRDDRKKRIERIIARKK